MFFSSGSGQIIRCDVIIDNIDMIDIITTTRVLYLGDSPEEFELRALDDEGKQNQSILINTIFISKIKKH